MFLGIDRDIWLSILSGALGAIPAAVLAAFVAMAVLRRSNRKQHELVELQLKEQRREAALSRESAATADLVDAANGFIVASDAGWDEIQTQTMRFRAASFRWQMEIEDLDLVVDLIGWGNVLCSLANGKRAEGESGKGEREWSDELSGAIATIFAFSLTWYRMPFDRTAAVKSLKSSRLEYEKRIADLSSVE